MSPAPAAPSRSRRGGPGRSTGHLSEPCASVSSFPATWTSCVPPWVSPRSRSWKGRGSTWSFPRRRPAVGSHCSTRAVRARRRRWPGRFVEIFAGYERIVCPSASCVATVVRHYRGLLGPSAELEALEGRTHELCAFLVDVLGVERLPGRFPHRVGLHPSCHGLRELRQGEASERAGIDPPDPARQLLASLEGISLAGLRRADECCGFGGTFAVEEEAVSSRMGLDRLAAHEDAGVEVIASTDLSCLLHLEGLARRRGLPLRALHVAEILAGSGS